jgi:hypothetical protein
MLDRLAHDSLIGMVASFIIWSLYFAAVYSFQAVACIRGLDDIRVVGVDVVTLVLAGLTALTLAAIAYLGWRSLRLARLSLLAQAETSDDARADFMALTSAALAALAFIATLWVALPLLLLPLCA